MKFSPKFSASKLVSTPKRKFHKKKVPMKFKSTARGLLRAKSQFKRLISDTDRKKKS